MNSVVNKSDYFTSEFEINESPTGARRLLTKGFIQDEISRFSGAAISTRGRYIAKNERNKIASSNEKDRPLYLFIQGPTKQSIQIAIQKIHEIIHNDIGAATQKTGTDATNTYNRPMNNQPCYFEERLFVGLDGVPECFDLRGKIIGQGESNFVFIRNETGASVTLCGGTGGPGVEPLNLLLQHTDKERLHSAKLLAANLIETLAQEFHQSQMGIPMHMNVPPPVVQQAVPLHYPTPPNVNPSHQFQAGGPIAQPIHNTQLPVHMNIPPPGIHIPQHLGPMVPPPGTLNATPFPPNASQQAMPHQERLRGPPEYRTPPPHSGLSVQHAVVMRDEHNSERFARKRRYNETTETDDRKEERPNKLLQSPANRNQYSNRSSSSAGNVPHLPSASGKMQRDPQMNFEDDICGRACLKGEIQDGANHDGPEEDFAHNNSQIYEASKNNQDSRSNFGGQISDESNGCIQRQISRNDDCNENCNNEETQQSKPGKVPYYQLISGNAVALQEVGGNNNTNNMALQQSHMLQDGIEMNSGQTETNNLQPMIVPYNNNMQSIVLTSSNVQSPSSFPPNNVQMAVIPSGNVHTLVNPVQQTVVSPNFIQPVMIPANNVNQSSVSQNNIYHQTTNQIASNNFPTSKPEFISGHMPKDSQLIQINSMQSSVPPNNSQQTIIPSQTFRVPSNNLPTSAIHFNTMQPARVSPNGAHQFIMSPNNVQPAMIPPNNAPPSMVPFNVQPTVVQHAIKDIQQSTLPPNYVQHSVIPLNMVPLNSMQMIPSNNIQHSTVLPNNAQPNYIQYSVIPSNNMQIQTNSQTPIYAQHNVQPNVMSCDKPGGMQQPIHSNFAQQLTNPNNMQSSIIHYNQQSTMIPQNNPQHSLGSISNISQNIPPDNMAFVNSENSQPVVQYNTSSFQSGLMMPVATQQQHNTAMIESKNLITQQDNINTFNNSANMTYNVQQQGIAMHGGVAGNQHNSNNNIMFAMCTTVPPPNVINNNKRHPQQNNTTWSNNAN